MAFPMAGMRGGYRPPMTIPGRGGYTGSGYAQLRGGAMPPSYGGGGQPPMQGGLGGMMPPRGYGMYGQSGTGYDNRQDGSNNFYNAGTGGQQRQQYQPQGDPTIQNSYSLYPFGNSSPYSGPNLSNYNPMQQSFGMIRSRELGGLGTYGGNQWSGANTAPTRRADGSYGNYDAAGNYNGAPVNMDNSFRQDYSGYPTTTSASQAYSGYPSATGGGSAAGMGAWRVGQGQPAGWQPGMM